MVFEYMEHDLTGLLGHPDVNLTIEQVKCLSKQLFAGLGYLHNFGILHRDIKGTSITDTPFACSGTDALGRIKPIIELSG